MIYPILCEDINTALQVDVPTDLEGLQKEFEPNAVERWLQTLPDKAMSLGIRVLLTVIFVVAGYFVIKFVRKILKHSLEKAGVEKGVRQFVDSFLNVALWTFVALTVAVNYGFDAASVVAILGSAGLAVGLSLQGALSNFAGGILILILKPFKVGDYIIEDTAKNEGTVTEISIIYTRLRTVDNKVIVVPNGTLANSSLTNLTTLDKRMMDLSVGISYGSDIKKAKEIAENVLKNNQFVLEGPPITVFVKELGESSVVIGFRAWVNTSDYWNARWGVLEEIKNEFDAGGIEIPFNQLDVHVK